MYKFKSLVVILAFVLSSCGGSKDNSKNEFYKTKEVIPNNLEVTVEASGMVEAISSVAVSYTHLRAHETQ